MVCGLVLDCTALFRSWLFKTYCSLALVMNAAGQTMFMISWRTNSFAAEVLMLNPARFSSSAMVAVPPEEDDALVDAPLVAGVTTTSDIVSAPAARAAYADRFNNPFSPIALPCSPVAPVTAASHRSRLVERSLHSPQHRSAEDWLNVT